MKAFWYETNSIDDKPEILAPLALAFDFIVVPNRDAHLQDIFLDHNLLERPFAIRDETTHCFAILPNQRSGTPIPPIFESYRFSKNYMERTMNTHCAGDADAESDMVEFARAQQAEANFRNFIAYAIHNHGVLVGETGIVSSLLPQINCQYHDNDVITHLLFGLLSVAGIEIALPPITAAHLDDILEIRRKFEAERKEYSAYIWELLGNGYSIISADLDYQELVNWSSFVALTKIRPALDKLILAIQRGLHRKFLERITIAVTEKAPSLVASGLVAGANQNDVLINSVASLLSIVAPKLFESLVEKASIEKAFGVGYLYRLSKQFMAEGKR